MYLSYDDYAVLTGNTMTTAEFTRLEFKARKAVDTATFGRFKSLTYFPEELKMLMVELINTESTAPDANVASESYSQGGISQSKTYITKGDGKGDPTGDLICQYLCDVEVYGTYVLYRGGDD